MLNFLMLRYCDCYFIRHFHFPLVASAAEPPYSNRATDRLAAKPTLARLPSRLELSHALVALLACRLRALRHDSQPKIDDTSRLLAALAGSSLESTRR